MAFPVIPVIILVVVLIGFILDRSFTWELIKELAICFGLALVFTAIINVIIKIPSKWLLVVVGIIMILLFFGHFMNQRRNPYASQMR